MESDMALRCKVGDLAIRVRAHSRSIIPPDSVVEVLSLAGTGWCARTGQTYQNVWHVRWAGKTVNESGIIYGLPDAHLQPIRDQPGADETLEWLAVPGRVVEEVS